VLVNRGWVAAAATRGTLPEIDTPRGELRISGLALAPKKRFFELSSDVVEGRVWENLDLERYRRAFPITVLPVIIQQDNELNDGLKREWRSVDLGIQKHYSYAGQWFLLGATILIFYLVTHVKRSA
jgi:surfeit locus 1 family protein